MKHLWLYPANWQELALICKERARRCCEFCGAIHGKQAISERTGKVYTISLASAHLDHDPWNENPRLAALCPSCHARYNWQDLERKRWLELEILRHHLWVQAHGYGKVEETH